MKDIILEIIINKLKAESNLTEEIKNTDVLFWVGTMNSIKEQAEEIIYNAFSIFMALDLFVLICPS